MKIGDKVYVAVEGGFTVGSHVGSQYIIIYQYTILAIDEKHATVSRSGWFKDHITVFHVSRLFSCPKLAALDIIPKVGEFFEIIHKE